MSNEEISAIIEAHRLAHKLTKRDVSRGLDIAYGTYCYYEYGKRRPDNSTLIKIAEFYGETLDEFLGIKKEPLPENPFPGEAVYQFLIDVGLVKDGEDLSDLDLEFMSTILDLLAEWFKRNPNA